MLVGRGLIEPNEETAVDFEVGGDADEGELVVLATPLGNLGDISRRALGLLAIADVVYCEDTRHSSTLFSSHDIAVKGRLRALHEHNEASLCDEVVSRVASGQTVVLMSDAGTPGICDPGSRVVAAVADAGLRVTTAPGPSAVVAALSISGLSTDRFVMEGFLGRKVGEREVHYGTWRSEPRTIVFYESPQRLTTTLSELEAHFADRRIAVVRELTKMHEEVIRGTVGEVARLLRDRDVLGEIVVVLEGAPDATSVDDESVRIALRELLATSMSVRDAVAVVADSLGVSHRTTYRLALELKADEGS